MAALLSAGITPVVREYGSLGCSGDLAPLSHCALALMGEGEVRDADGTLMPAADALAAAGLTPVELKAKEGLALINGTDGMLGMLVLAITDLRMLLRTADIAAAMSVEAQMGTDRVFAAELQELRPQVGQGALGRQPPRRARRLGRDGQPPGGHVPPGAGRLLAALLAAGARRRPRHRRARRHHRRARAGARRSTTRWSSATRSAVQRQLPRRAGRRTCSTSSRSSPPTSASISERRTDRFLDRARNHDLPPFLADDPGVDSGHMIAQYTQAAIVSEMKRLAVPASVDSIPSQRDAGGPRVDGLERRAQAAPLGRRAVPGGRDRAADRGPRARLPASARAGRRHRRRRRPAARERRRRGPAPTATCPRRSRPPSRSSSPAPCSPPSSRRSESSQ